MEKWRNSSNSSICSDLQYICGRTSPCQVIIIQYEWFTDGKRERSRNSIRNALDYTFSLLAAGSKRCHEIINERGKWAWRFIYSGRSRRSRSSGGQRRLGGDKRRDVVAKSNISSVKAVRENGSRRSSLERPAGPRAGPNRALHRCPAQKWLISVRGSGLRGPRQRPKPDANIRGGDPQNSHRFLR